VPVKRKPAEDCALQSMPDASPVKWRYGPFDPAYRVLFNSYYNAVGEKHPRAAQFSGLRLARDARA
jgi:hypothetical protein